ncbi:extracellular glycoprotein lacritin isoform X1 [Bos indicus]|uniref:Extracellular glycoprotein lacritin isoform X1 n=1 Tax=Bos indicus TaxID=9915 RepID=A0ABM4SAI2_BOSIN|nr:uncharacterized protein LOC113893256 isoform X1 [Bos indicus x Bos taurus]
MRHTTLLLLAALVGTLVFAQNASSALAEGLLTSDEGTPAPTESASPQNTASATQKILTAPPSSEFNPLQLGFGKGISVAQEIRKKIRERIDGGKKFIEEGTAAAQTLGKKLFPTILLPGF